MNALESEILDNLKRLDEMVRSIKTANPKPDLLPVFERLDGLARQLGPESDASLRHYLQKKSYEKALLYLQNLQPPKGSCGH